MQKNIKPAKGNSNLLFHGLFVEKPVPENGGATLLKTANNRPINCQAFFSVVHFKHCPLWIASTEQAIFYAGFLTDDFPISTHQQQAKKLNHWIINNNLNERKQPLPNEYLLIGTPFQQAVWQALSNIPTGRLCTYKTLGQWLNPICIGYQAIGRAVGANPIGGLIPCHRVVAANGQLSGFRWGVNIKQLLLNTEAASLKLE